MCYIMISKKINNNRDLSIESKIKKVALEKMEANHDGFFISDGAVPLRTMDKNAATQKIKAIPFDNAIMHFRFATVGVKDITNVHGWEKNGFQFIHNGGVSEYEPERKSYQGYKYSDEEGLEWANTDSKMLFDDLMLRIAKEGNSDKKIIKAIKWTINNCSFWGRAVLIDKAQDKAYLFGDWHVYLAEKQYLVFSSHDISFEQDYSLKTHGCKFEYSVAPFLESTFDGIVQIKNFSKPNFHCKYRGELEDKMLDEREYDPKPQAMDEEDYYGSTQDDDTYFIKTKSPDQEVREYNEGFGIYDEEFDDIWQIPEYQNMNPFDMKLNSDPQGVLHDEYGICCEYGTCWIYESQEYLDYQEEILQNQNQQELNFLNGIKQGPEGKEIAIATHGEQEVLMEI